MRELSIQKDPKKQIEMPFRFFDWLRGLPAETCAALRAKICAELDYTEDEWYNRAIGRTDGEGIRRPIPFNPTEREIIQEITGRNFLWEN